MREDGTPTLASPRGKRCAPSDEAFFTQGECAAQGCGGAADTPEASFFLFPGASMTLFRSTQARYTAFVVAYFLLLTALTLAVVRVFVTPDLRRSEAEIVGRNVDEIGIDISNKLRQVEAQQRSITQTVALMDSASIDRLQPGLVDQYGDVAFFGGGIWPLPFKRDPAKERASTFFARDASGKLLENIHWN